MSAYIARVVPIERALEGEEPIQMMLCGTVERMRRAEARLLEHPGVSAAVGRVSLRRSGLPRRWRLRCTRTEYPARDLSIVDIFAGGLQQRIGAACGWRRAEG